MDAALSAVAESVLDEEARAVFPFAGALVERGGAFSHGWVDWFGWVCKALDGRRASKQ